MSTLELKEYLKNQIDSVDNEAILNEINSILNLKYNPTDSYNIDLAKSENDILNNHLFSHNEVLEKIELWKRK